MSEPENRIRVRAAVIGDIDTIVDFNAAMALETESKKLPRDVLGAGVRAVFDEPKRGFYRVAEMDGNVVGCLMITFEWSDWRNGDWWWLQSVYVAPEARRVGVFRALYDTVERRARGDEFVVGLRLYVERENRAAQATYVHLGMQLAEYDMYVCPFPGGRRA
jgi:ribosomal protein S18 acetylase RimI-like enzyme